MKKLFPLLILVILFVSMPSVNAETESLYVDSYTGDLANWDERNEPSPYLADEDTGFVHEVKTSGATEGYFGFADPSGTDTINSVTLYLECYGDDTDEQIHIYVDCSDEGGWLNEGTINVDQTSYGWEMLSLTSRLDSWSDIQNAQIYLSYFGVLKGNDVFVGRAYLYVDYTPSSGTEYSRDVSQYLSWSGVGYRIWDASRDSTQSLTLSSDSGRTWTLTRAFTQSLTFSSSALVDLMEYILIQVSQSIAFTPETLRTWDLSRTFTQGFTFDSSVESFAQFLRNPTQIITASAEAFRSWTLTRIFSLPMTFSSTAIVDIFKVFQRSLTLGIQISSDAFREWSISRVFTQGLSFNSLTDRNWSLIRIATQSLTTNIEVKRIVSAIRQLSQNIAISSNAGRIGTFLRGLSQSITLSSETIRSWSLSRSFTQGLSFASSIWTHLTVGAEQFLRTLTLSMSLSTESTRSWNLARTLTQGISFSSLSGRSWSLIRLATQSITANIEANRILLAIRQASQNIALSSNVERLVSFTRGLSQSISLGSEAFRTWSLSRSFTQGLSIISSIFVKLTEYIPDPPDPEEFFRAVSIGIELVSSNIRQWSLTRIFSQVISFSSNIWTKLYVGVIRRVATMALNLDMQLSFVATIIMKNNMEVIGLIGLSLILQIAYMYLIYKEYNPLYRAILGIVAMACWFATGHVSLSLNPNEGMAISAIYDIIGTIDALFAVKAALDFMQLSQKADDFWEIN